MNIEKLLVPRWKVILDYPWSPFGVGHILCEQEGELGFYPEGVTASKSIVMIEDVGKYPHLFQPLEWWQERKIEEMPEYVKTAKTNKVYRTEWETTYTCRDADGDFTRCFSRFILKEFLPATETEYLAYKNSVK